MQKFSSKNVLMTQGVAEMMPEHRADILAFMSRHFSGDWGEIDPQDAGINDRALVSGARLLSVYRLADGERIWIITDGDDDYGIRYATTILLPAEY